MTKFVVKREVEVLADKPEEAVRKAYAAIGEDYKEEGEATYKVFAGSILADFVGKYKITKKGEVTRLKK